MNFPTKRQECNRALSAPHLGRVCETSANVWFSRAFGSLASQEGRISTCPRSLVCSCSPPFLSPSDSLLMRRWWAGREIGGGAACEGQRGAVLMMFGLAGLVSQRAWWVEFNMGYSDVVEYLVRSPVFINDGWLLDLEYIKHFWLLLGWGKSIFKSHISKCT